MIQSITNTYDEKAAQARRWSIGEKG